MKDLDTFLYNKKSNKNDEITHTKIGYKKTPIIYGGSFTIEEKDMNKFYKLYHKKVFIDKKHEFMTEKQLKEGGPILVDIDLRYDKDIMSRQHTDGHISDIVDLYLEKIAQILKLSNQTRFSIFVMEKENVNTENPNYTKDGIHIVFCIHMDHTQQLILRDKVLTDIPNILEDLPLTNDYESVFDDGITKGHTNWQLFGSRKPMNEQYKLKKYIEVEWESEEWSFEINANRNFLEILPKISARNENIPKFDMNEEYNDLYNQIKRKITKKKKPVQKKTNFKIPNWSIANEWANISDENQLNAALEASLKLAKMHSSDHHIHETHEFTMILPPEYYNDFNKWIRVGWALHNTDIRMFLTWIKFSSQSEKFNYDDIPTRYEEWTNMNDEGFTERSIMYWAREAHPGENSKYQKIKKNTIDYFIEKTLDGATEFDIASVLYHLFKDNFCCPSLKNKLWYEFKNHKWTEIDYGTNLRHLISTKLMQEYSKRSQDQTDKLTSGDVSPEDHDNVRKKASMYSDIAIKCKKTVNKNNIMREASELFYNRIFLNKLDTNTNLMCFKNGVVDFKQKEFRDGKPEDYISLCTDINYIPYDVSNNEHRKIKKEIEQFMSDLFPKKELRHYMWDHLASVLIGTNENQTFNIYNGKGSNGKSKLVELMALCLGDYKADVPIQLITQKRTGIGHVTPELAKLKGKRYAVMQEPSKGDKINEGMMKQITGGDPMQGRALFKDAVIFVPQFTLVVCTNTLFDIKSNDEGTWRRIRVSDFISHFVEKPTQNDEEDPYQFKIDKNLTKKLKKWKEIFISLLVQRAFETQGIVNDCDIVLQKSNEYRKDQDYLTEFYDTWIIKSEEPSDRPLKKREVYDEFKSWFEDTYGNNIPKGKELYSYLDKKLGKSTKKGWKGYKINYAN